MQYVGYCTYISKGSFVVGLSNRFVLSFCLFIDQVGSNGLEMVW